MARDQAAYMRRWRQNSPEGRERQRAEHRARCRAQVKLASLHQEEFDRLLNAEREVEGLPPVHTVKLGRPPAENRGSTDGSLRS